MRTRLVNERANGTGWASAQGLWLRGFPSRAQDVGVDPGPDTGLARVPSHRDDAGGCPAFFQRAHDGPDGVLVPAGDVEQD